MKKRRNDIPSCDLTVLESAACLGTWCWRPEDDGMSWSDGLARAWRLTDEVTPAVAVLIGACHPLDRAGLQAAFDAAKDSGSAFTLRHRVMANGTDVRHMVTYGHPKDGAIHGLSQDITDIIGDEAEMRAVFDGAYSAILLINRDGTVRSINPTGVEQFGYQADEIVGQNIAMLFRAPYAEQVVKQLGGERVTSEIVAHCRDGSTLPVTFSTSVIEDDDGGHYVVFMRAISEIKAREVELMAVRDRFEQQAIRLAALTEESHANAAKLEVANQELTRLATTDSLTGMLNRRMALERGAGEYQRVQRYGGEIGVVGLDIDHFKQVNDTYGHGGGDAALRAVAQACQSCLRVVDTFGRMGGEEFLAVLPQTGRQGAEIVAEKMRATVESLIIEHGDDTITVTLSVGVTVLTKDTGNLEAAIERADRALYWAKNSGRNRVAFEAAEKSLSAGQKQA